MRKLASIRRISNIKDIPDAEFIQAYQVDGWWVVGKKNQFKINELVCYFEIDSWIPHEIAPFLSKGMETIREYMGVKGERLRTLTMRGQISQGLILPLDDVLFPESRIQDLKEDEDVTSELGILLYEKPLSPDLEAECIGYMPSTWHKTDQERIQNLTKEFQHHYDMNTKFEVTIKLDGTSMSVGLVRNYDTGGLDYAVCGRELRFKTEDNDENTYVKVASKIGLESHFKMKPDQTSLKVEKKPPIQFSGELIGEGIQGNPEKIKGHDFYIFDIYSPNDRIYVIPEHRQKLIAFLNDKYGLNLKHVPILHNDVSFKDLDIHSIDDLLEFANGKSLNAEKREGLVFKQMDGDFSFKVISNDYLLKT